MQALFTAIIAGDVDTVRTRLAKNPEAVALVASASPKRYAGRSPLMVALIAGEFELANLLLDHGADVDFVDSSPDDFRRPVLQDAITAAVLRSRPTPAALRSGIDRATPAFAVLERMVDAGADVDAVDSMGGGSLSRAAHDAWQILPRSTADEIEPVFAHNLERIFTLLQAHGQSADHSDPQLGRSLRQHYASTHVGRFFQPA